MVARFPCKFAAKCRIALLLSVVFKPKTGKRIPKSTFTSFRMMRQYDECGFMLLDTVLEGRPCPKIHVCVRSCFEESYLVEVKLMGSSNSTKSLKTSAIPTLFSHKPPKGGRASSVQLSEKRERERERRPGKLCNSNTNTNRLWLTTHDFT